MIFRNKKGPCIAKPSLERRSPVSSLGLCSTPTVLVSRPNERTLSITYCPYLHIQSCQTCDCLLGQMDALVQSFTIFIQRKNEPNQNDFYLGYDSMTFFRQECNQHFPLRTRKTTHYCNHMSVGIEPSPYDGTHFGSQHHPACSTNNNPLRRTTSLLAVVTCLGYNCGGQPAGGPIVGWAGMFSMVILVFGSQWVNLYTEIVLLYVYVWTNFSHGTLQALWSAVHGLFPRIVSDNGSGVFFGPTIAPIP
jgi:hypothetical protein